MSCCSSSLRLLRKVKKRNCCTGYAERKKTAAFMISVVMEPASGAHPEMRKPARWEGTVGMALGGHLYIDLSGDEGAPEFAAKIDELAARIQVLSESALEPAGPVKTTSPASVAVAWPKELQELVSIPSFAACLSELSVHCCSMIEQDQRYRGLTGSCLDTVFVPFPGEQSNRSFH